MIRLELDGPVGRLTLDRPGRRNAVDHAALDDLAAALTAAAGCRALVLAGAGGHFCAGADLSSVEDEGFLTRLGEVLAALQDLPCPTIAAVEGAAMGAGTQLAVACDLRVATADSRWGVPAAKLGLMVDRLTLQRVSALVGQGTARAIFLGAEVLTGERAHQLGLVQRLGSPADAAAWAASLAELAPLTIAGHKAGLNGLVGAPTAEQPAELAAEQAYRAAFARAWASADLQEGLAAFREGRPPRFVGE